MRVDLDLDEQHTGQTAKVALELRALTSTIEILQAVLAPYTHL